MLAHSPPLPLTVDYRGSNGISAEDEEGLMVALEQRDRVRHLRLSLPVRNLQKFVVAIDGEFPILEYMVVGPPIVDSTALTLRETLQAPHLKHLMLTGFAYPIGPRLHPTAVGLVTLNLLIHQQSAYFQPNILLQWISFMPQLEILAIAFRFPIPNHDVEREVAYMPIPTPITLPNLRWLWFQGASAYLEAIVCWTTTPRLERLHIEFFEQLTFSVPRLVQFMKTTKIPRFDRAVLDFSDKDVYAQTFLRETGAFVITIIVHCGHLNRQVSSVAQISSALGEGLSAVEHLNLRDKTHTRSSEEHNDIDRFEWRKLLRAFNNVKSLHVEDGLVKELSRCLRSEDGELPLDPLPELQELTHFWNRDTVDAFTSFIDARQNIGRPVMLVRLLPRRSPR